MPELPEVEVVVRQLRRVLVGRRLGRLRAHHPDVLLMERGMDPALTRGQRVGGVWRRAKLIGMDVGSELVLTVHLRMTGHLWVAPRREIRPVHTHVSLELEPDQELRFRDPRRFGRVRLLSRGGLTSDPFLRRLGPEPLELSSDDLARRLAARTGAIKGALLDQSLVAGLGNIYVDEILFAVGLHPHLVANRLRREEIVRLHGAMQSILAKAIAAGGSTIRDYRGLDARAGEFQRQHQVFGREGRPCGVCGTTIVKTKVVGRGTRFCPACQPRRRRRPRPRVPFSS